MLMYHVGQLDCLVNVRLSQSQQPLMMKVRRACVRVVILVYQDWLNERKKV